MDEIKVDLSGRRLMGYARVIQSPSDSRDDLVHYTMVFMPLDEPARLHCSCEGFKFTQHCKHLDQLTKDDLEWWKVMF